MSYRSFAVTVPGISHIKQGKGCEDKALHSEEPQGPLSFAVVADGHGDPNCFRSAQGASFAACAAEDGIRAFADQVGPSAEITEASIRTLVKHIICSWQGKVQEDCKANPVQEEELAQVSQRYRKRYANGADLSIAYGTTLIAAAITEDYWFGLHIGDGRFTVLYQDGTLDQPVPWDERCYLNVTTSICDADALKGARVYVAQTRERAPVGIFLCSDGVDDTYPVEHNEEYLYTLYRTITLTFAEDGFASTCAQLEELATLFATKGKGDDTSIAGIIDIEAAKRIAPLLREAAGPQTDQGEPPKEALSDRDEIMSYGGFEKGGT